MEKITHNYTQKCNTPSDIYQHLPTLKRLAGECDTIVEFGVRGITSTWALLAGRPKRLLSVDPIEPSVSGGNLDGVKEAAEEAGIQFTFQQADDRQIVIEPTDMLFIDTWHVYDQLKAELELHARKVNKFIVMHDTVTFAEQGETQGHRGLMPAVNEFLASEEGQGWTVREHHANCNGLMVLERVRPKIKVIAFFYREEFLVPFFLSHYRWADKIHAVVSSSPDRTRELLVAAPNVEIEDFDFPAGMDDLIKVRHLNSILSRKDVDYDWHIVVDSDEFIWPAGNVTGSNARSFLTQVPKDDVVLVARMQNVFRHETDSDLDPAKEPVVLQRRHGIPGDGGENAPYQKPIVFRSNRGVQFVPGNHAVTCAAKFSETHFFAGSHWGNADPAFCIQRRVRDRRDRLSQSNRSLGLGTQHFNTSEADVIGYCAKHLKDPEVI